MLFTSAPGHPLHRGRLPLGGAASAKKKRQAGRCPRRSPDPGRAGAAGRPTHCLKRGADFFRVGAGTGGRGRARQCASPHPASDTRRRQRATEFDPGDHRLARPRCWRPRFAASLLNCAPFCFAPPTRRGMDMPLGAVEALLCAPAPRPAGGDVPPRRPGCRAQTRMLREFDCFPSGLYPPSSSLTDL